MLNLMTPESMRAVASRADGPVGCLGGDNLALEQIPSTEDGNWLPVRTHLLAWQRTAQVRAT